VNIVDDCDDDVDENENDGDDVDGGATIRISMIT